MVESETKEIKFTYDSSKPSLVYFNLQAKGESIRMLCHHSKLEFNDITLEFDQWPTIKPMCPAGQVPLWIEPNGEETEESILPQGTTYNQANAILKMLGKKQGYMSDDPVEGY